MIRQLLRLEMSVKLIAFKHIDSLMEIPHFPISVESTSICVAFVISSEKKTILSTKICSDRDSEISSRSTWSSPGATSGTDACACVGVESVEVSFAVDGTEGGNFTYKDKVMLRWGKGKRCAYRMLWQRRSPFLLPGQTPGNGPLAARSVSPTAALQRLGNREDGGLRGEFCHSCKHI